MSLEEAFQCPLCLDVATNAVETQCCNQVYCEKEVQELPEKTCPSCQTNNFQYKASVVVRRAVGNLPVECPNKCEKKISRGNLHKHLKTCPGDCPNKCQEKISLDNLQAHLKICPNREFVCTEKGCRKRCNSDEYIDHWKTQHKAKCLRLLSTSEEENDEPEAGPSGITTDEKNKITVTVGRNGRHHCGKEFSKHTNLFLSFSALPSFPTNTSCSDSGDNCASCMKLDVTTRHLPPGSLVNGEGRVCTPIPCVHPMSDMYIRSHEKRPSRCFQTICGHSSQYKCGTGIGVKEDIKVHTNCTGTNCQTRIEVSTTETVMKQCGAQSTNTSLLVCDACKNLSSLVNKGEYDSIWD